MEIKFFDGEIWDSGRDGMVFSANQNGKKIMCFISREALDDDFNGDDYQKTADAFLPNKKIIQNLAEKLIQLNRFENDEIVIRSGDSQLYLK